MEYPKRSSLERELYESLKRNLLERHEGTFDLKEKESEGELLVKKLYLEPQDGCVPEEFIGEELLYAIKSKYYEFFAVMRDKLQAEYLDKRKIPYPLISIWIDPAYEDTTCLLVTFQRAVLFEEQSKAWNFCWASRASLRREMADIYFEMRDRLNQYLLEGIRYEQ